MKKIISIMLVILMIGAITGCGETADKPSNENLKEPVSEIVNKVVKENPVEFQGATKKLDLKDTSEEGKWLIQSTLGMDDVSKIKEAAAFEPEIGSLAFSLVMVRVKDSADTKAVAEEMKKNIDPRKWICVEANDIKAAGYGDVIMFIMLDDGLDLKAQDFVDGFKKVCGADPDFTI